MVYENLIKQFEELSDYEKNLLYIYKSRLGRAINDLDNYEELMKTYAEYKKLVNDPKNFFIKMSVFNIVNFNSYEEFADSLKIIKEELLTVLNKLKTKEEITVYRAISINENEKLNDISKDKIISTSLDIVECLNFFILNKNYKHYLYEIKINSNSPVAICPYAILINMVTNQLTISKRKDQSEIILLKDNYDFELTKSENSYLANNEKLVINHCYARKKEDEKIL